MAKPKSFRPWLPEQSLLLTPSALDWLPGDHVVFFLLERPAELDFEPFLAPSRHKDPRGEKGFDPRMMALLLHYAYCEAIGRPGLQRPVDHLGDLVVLIGARPAGPEFVVEPPDAKVEIALAPCAYR